MKKEGRVKLYVLKKLPSGRYDSFSVVVSEKEELSAKQKYKSAGYEVIRI